MSVSDKPRFEVDLSHLPDCPGAYLMKDRENRILYVGKANNLRSRVRSHFSHPPSRFAPLVDRVEYIAAENSGEALLLEYNLIKKHHPPFNIRLRDDKRYPYIKLTMAETWPRAYLTRSLKEDGSYYFGPYPNVRAARLVLGAVKEIFPYRSCKYLSKDFPLPRPCIDYEMKKCVGPCIGAIPQEEYRDLCKEVARFLKGQSDEVKRTVKEKMTSASDRMQYEKAASYRDILAAIETLGERQIISTLAHSGKFTEQNEDYLGLARCGDVTAMVVLKKRTGRIIASEYYFLDGEEKEDASGEDDKAVFEAFIPQYYDKVSDYPRRIFVPQPLPMKEALESFVASQASQRVQLLSPQRGEKRKTVEMARQNAQLRADEQFRKTHGVRGVIDPAVEQLQRALGLAKPPLRIEGYDISNISGTDAVGSMVVLQGGRPHRSGYRKFRIKRVEGIDDYAMMQEMLSRRLDHRGDERFGPWPDLFLIDGGKGHLASALAILREKGELETPIVSLAKQEELIFTPEKEEPIRLSEDSPALKLLQRLRDEAHRFAITYHRTLRSKKLSHSVLEEIEGLGRKRKQNLIRYFGSVEAIAAAEAEEIAKVPGIPGALAQRIKEHLKTHYPE